MPSKPRFEIIEHTADVGIRVAAPTLSELFGSAAMALTELMVETMNAGKTQSHEIQLENLDLESLLYDWIAEFIYLFDAEQLILTGFERLDVTAGNEQCSLIAQTLMRRFDPATDCVKTYVKAVTYHQLKIEYTGSDYTAQLIVDI